MKKGTIKFKGIKEPIKFEDLVGDRTVFNMLLKRAMNPIKDKENIQPKKSQHSQSQSRKKPVY